MKVAFRAVAVCLVLALAGSMAPLASAQQPVTPPAAQPVAPAPPPATPPQMYQEDVKAVPPREGVDIYDVGAVAATAAGLPFKAALCGLGAVFGAITFAATFASRPDASAAIIHEGCGGKSPWIVRGRDLRPRPDVSKAFDWENHRFEWEK